jgi:hypothetical protein
MSRWHSANVIKATPALSQLWRFSAEGEHFVFEQGQTFLPSEPFPRSLVGKEWSSLIHRKFNVAWIPPEKVFLHVVHLPTSDPAEIQAMVELQLEKISPVPVAQIVWSIEILPRKSDKPEELQTVIVIIVARNHAEEYLGGLEAKGYLADRLESSSLDQLLATKIQGDGAWIYIGEEGEPALIAWWCAGVLQHLALVAMPTGEDKAIALKTQIEQIAWAGELEGWLTGSPQLHLVAEPSEVSFWEPLMRTWSDQPLQIVQPVAPKDLAALSAQRAAGVESKSNLLPPEFAVRYKQQFVDGLWMRGLLATLAVYALAVAVYLAALFVFKMQCERVENYVASIKGTYTEALRDKARIAIVKDRQELKYAALDCWKAVAETLPEGVVVETVYFQRGRLDLRGTVSADQQSNVTDFNEAIRKVSGNDGLMFSEVTPPSLSARGATADWRFSCILKGGDK